MYIINSKGIAYHPLEEWYIIKSVTCIKKRRISPKANIPALALSERAPYGFVWYVHPYLRTRLSVIIFVLHSFDKMRALVISADDFNRNSTKIQKDTLVWCPFVFCVHKPILIQFAYTLSNSYLSVSLLYHKNDSISSEIFGLR